MPRKDKNRLQLAAKIRESRNKQKASTFTRPGEDKKVKEARKRMESKSRMPKLDKDIKDHNDRIRKKRMAKKKKGFFSKLFGAKK